MVDIGFEACLPQMTEMFLTDQQTAGRSSKPNTYQLSYKFRPQEAGLLHSSLIIFTLFALCVYIQPSSTPDTGMSKVRAHTARAGQGFSVRFRHTSAGHVFGYLAQRLPTRGSGH